MMKHLAWIIRHPIYAAVWHLTGEPYSVWFKEINSWDLVEVNQ